MNNPYYGLSPRESEVLRLLGHGYTYKDILAQLNERPKYYGNGIVRQVTLDNLHVVMNHIRKKTGIKDTRDPKECRDYIRTQRDAPVTPYTPKITPTQMDVLRLIGEGKPYHEIAKLMGVGMQTVQNYAHRGCKRAGIFDAGAQRTEKIRQFLASKASESPQKEKINLDEF